MFLFSAVNWPPDCSFRNKQGRVCQSTRGKTNLLGQKQKDDLKLTQQTGWSYHRLTHIRANCTRHERRGRVHQCDQMYWCWTSRNIRRVKVVSWLKTGQTTQTQWEQIKQIRVFSLFRQQKMTEKWKGAMENNWKSIYFWFRTCSHVNFFFAEPLEVVQHKADKQNKIYHPRGD